MFPQNCNILVCDDSKVSRSLAIKFLNNQGYKNIDEADCAESALKLLFESPIRRYELLLLDISMPGILGTELVEKIRKSGSKYKDVSIIMISAESEKKTVLDALLNGANDYILKPLTNEILSNKMQVVWDKLPDDKKSNVILRSK